MVQPTWIKHMVNGVRKVVIPKTLAEAVYIDSAMKKNAMEALAELEELKLNIENVVNNLTTTAAGKALDARQGKALSDAIALKLAAEKVVNNLTTTTAGYALDARQGKTLSDAIALKLAAANVVNNLTTTASGYALDARQGKTLNDAIALKLNIASLANNLTTTGSGYALDARQGRALERSKMGIISLWSGSWGADGSADIEIPTLGDYSVLGFLCMNKIVLCAKSTSMFVDVGSSRSTRDAWYRTANISASGTTISLLTATDERHSFANNTWTIAAMASAWITRIYGIF